MLGRWGRSDDPEDGGQGGGVKVVSEDGKEEGEVEAWGWL